MEDLCGIKWNLLSVHGNATSMEVLGWAVNRILLNACINVLEFEFFYGLLKNGQNSATLLYNWEVKCGTGIS